MEDCPKGIKNEKDIENLRERVSIMFEHINEEIEKLSQKIDKLDHKIEDLKTNIPKQIEGAVDARWKNGVYGVVKFILVTVTVAIIGGIVRLYL
jgi:predicted  nucleic acid-binding Zn-ribbon protein